MRSIRAGSEAGLARDGEGGVDGRVVEAAAGVGLVAELGEFEAGAEILAKDFGVIPAPQIRAEQANPRPRTCSARHGFPVARVGPKRGPLWRQVRAACVLVSAASRVT